MRSGILRFDPVWPSILGLAASIVLVIIAEPAIAQPPASIWSEPRLPGAVIVAPDWLKDAPFDAAQFFAMPPDAENAAPLYLDVFFEFGSEVADCFPLDQRRRAAVARDRSDRLMAIYRDWDDDPKSVLAEKIDGLLAEFKEGFRKLELALQRPHCVFAIGLTFESPVAHAQVARNVVRALRLEVSRSLDRGEFQRAIDDIAKMLRISRDLRPRGAAICQLVSIGIDASARSSIESLLAHPRIEVEHCDGLLRVLAEHKAKGVDLFASGVKAEYVLVRSTLRSFAEGTRMTIDAEGRPFETKLDRAEVARRLAEFLQEFGHEKNPLRVADPKELDDPAYLERMATFVDTFAREAAKDRRLAAEFTGSLLEANANYAERSRVLADLEEILSREDSPTLLKWVQTDFKMHVLSSARDSVYLGAAQCLIALRRWQLTHSGATPTDLAEASRVAGLTGVPLDPFSGLSLKLAVIEGEPVIYSVGDDGRDDRALKDADLGRKPGTEGDYLFRFKAGK